MFSFVLLLLISQKTSNKENHGIKKKKESKYISVTKSVLHKHNIKLLTTNYYSFTLLSFFLKKTHLSQENLTSHAYNKRVEHTHVVEMRYFWYKVKK